MVSDVHSLRRWITVVRSLAGTAFACWLVMVGLLAFGFQPVLSAAAAMGLAVVAFVSGLGVRAERSWIVNEE